MSRRSTSAWRTPAMLLALSFIPVIAGATRVVGFVSGAGAPEDARFTTSPTPIVIHAVSAFLYAALGAFQFSRELRARLGVWHRRLGRVLAACGLLTATTGLWMAQRYDIPRSQQGPLLYSVRMAVGVAMAYALLAGWRAVLRRDVSTHEAWMIRAYALAQGAGTQAVLMAPWTLIVGAVTGTTRDVLMSLAWVINVAVAERFIRRDTASERVTPVAVPLAVRA